MYVRSRSLLYTAIGYPNELATTRKKDTMMRPQLGNIPTDANRIETMRPCASRLLFT